MILWTIQPKEVATLLEQRGIFRCDKRKAAKEQGESFRDFSASTFMQAYDWMVGQMIKHGIQKDRRFPVWAWYRFNHRGKYKRGPRIAECRETCPLNQPFCRIKFDAPDRLVLLSDFSLWHAVLNQMYLGSEEEEKRDIKAAVEQARKENFLNYKRKSWERIFDLDLRNFDPKMREWTSQEKVTIQACLPYILNDWVLQVDHFVTTERSIYYRRKWGVLSDEPGFGRGSPRQLPT